MIGSAIFGLGALNLVLLLFQLSSGMRWIRVPVKAHRATGIALLVSACLHAGLAILVS